MLAAGLDIRIGTPNAAPAYAEEFGGPGGFLGTSFRVPRVPISPAVRSRMPVS
jgi:hypothetical protein